MTEDEKTAEALHRHSCHQADRCDATWLGCMDHRRRIAQALGAARKQGAEDERRAVVAWLLGAYTEAGDEQAGIDARAIERGEHRGGK